MGNCVCNGHNSTADQPHHRKIPSSASSSSSSDHHRTAAMIKVVTSNGGVMELYAPITADQITSEFPGHGLFQGPNPALSGPLRRGERLHPGQPYYLLPLSSAEFRQQGTTPFRMSFDAPRAGFRRSDPDAAAPKAGVWKVRLVINPEQLSEILSQEAKTEELIGSVRTVAKCGGASSSSAASSDSDHRSVSSCSFNWKNSL